MAGAGSTARVDGWIIKDRVDIEANLSDLGADRNRSRGEGDLWWRVLVAPLGACGLHRQNEIHAGVDGIVSKSLEDDKDATPRDMRAAPGTRRWQRQSECGWHRQTASSGRVRVAPPGSNTWTSADSPIEAGPSYRSCTASPQWGRGVTVPSLIETICEL